MSALANVLAVWVGKVTLALLRLLGRRGNALPGLVVEKLFPRYLTRAMARLPEGVVVVTGTNGKTTTTKMVATILGREVPGADQRHRQQLRPRRDHRDRRARRAGRADCPTTSRCSSSTRRGRCGSSQLSPPRRALLLNVMRDQLDRFGEIDTTAAAARQGRRGDHRPRRAQPRRRAHRGARAPTHGATCRYYGVGAELRELFPTDEELYGGPIALSPTCRPAAELLALPGRRRRAALRMRIGGAEHDVDAARRGPAQRAERGRRRGARADLRARRRRRSPPASPRCRRPSDAASASTSTAATSCCSW